MTQRTFGCGSASGTKRQPPDVNSSIVNEEQVYYVGKHGNDANDGLNIEEAKLTIAGALAAIAALPPVPGLEYVIRIHDGGLYVESFTVPSQVYLFGPGATVQGNIVLADDADVYIHMLGVTAGVGVSKTAGTGISRFQADIVSCATNTSAALNTAVNGTLFYDVKETLIVNGFGVGNATDAQGHVHLTCELIDIAGTGTAVARSGAGTFEGYVAHIMDGGAGTGINVAGGTISLIVDRLDCSVAYTVAAGAIMNLLINYLSGTETETGYANIILTQHPYLNVETDAVNSTGAAIITIREIVIPNEVHGGLTISVDGEHIGTPADALFWRKTFLVSGEAGGAVIRDATAVPFVLNPSGKIIFITVDTSGQNVRVRVTGPAGENWTWVAEMFLLSRAR